MKSISRMTKVFVAVGLFLALAGLLLPASSLEAQTAAPGWALNVHATNVSTVSGGEALAADLVTGDLFVKSLQDPLGSPVQLAKVTPSGAVTILGNLPADVQNSDLSGIALDPLTGGIIIADEQFAGLGGKIALVNPSTLTVSALFNIPWVMNPNSNGSGQQQYAPDPGNPNILYFWDRTLSKLFRLDRSTNALQELLAVDQGSPVGQHIPFNDVIFDTATGTLLVTDGSSNSVLEVNPSTSPATVITLFSGLAASPVGIALNPLTNEVFVVLGFNSIFVGPRTGGSLSLVASGFSFIDIVVGKATAGSGLSLFAVDKTQNTLYEITPSVVPFAAFNVKVEIDDDELEVKGTFTLGFGSDGIDIPTEILSLQLSGGSGAFSLNIPAGSFKQDKKGRFKFEGVIDGVELEMVIRPLGGAAFELKAEGEGADLTEIANPVTVSLTVGNDGGSITVEAEFE